MCQFPQLSIPKAFSEFDIIADGRIGTDDVVAFEKQFYIRAGEQEAEWLIREYDADEDGKLDQEEFQQMLLPATDQQLRDHVEDRVHAVTYRSDEALNDECCKELAGLI